MGTVFAAVTGIDWHDCGFGKAAATMSSLSSVPDPPAKGGKTIVTGKGHLSKAEATTNYELILVVDGVKLMDKKGDGCKPAEIKLPLNSGTMELPGFKCPLAVGDLTSTITINLAKSAPAGATNSTLKGFDADGNLLLCVTMAFKIPEDPLNSTKY